MKRFKLFLWVMALAVTLATGSVDAQRSTPVTVVNDASAPVPVNVTNAGTGSGKRVFVYVGRSGSATTPDVGNVTLNQLCSATFPGSRMCTTRELVETPDPPPTSGNQWLHPSLTGAVINVGGVDHVVDYIGVSEEPVNLTCGTTNFNGGPWTRASGGFGLIYTPSNGQIVFGACNAIRPVACCAPES